MFNKIIIYEEPLWISGLLTIYHIFFIYIYISYVRVYAHVLLLNGWTDFDEIFCVWLRWIENGLDSQFYPIENGLLINLFIYVLFWWFRFPILPVRKRWDRVLETVRLLRILYYYCSLLK